MSRGAAQEHAANECEANVRRHVLRHGSLPGPYNPERASLSDRFLRRSDLELLAMPRSLVEDVLYRHEYVLVSGRHGTDKTFICLDLSFCLATGIAWHGHAVDAVRVLYIAAEGAHGIGRRVAARRHRRAASPASAATRLRVDRIAQVVAFPSRLELPSSCARSRSLRGTKSAAALRKSLRASISSGIPSGSRMMVTDSKAPSRPTTQARIQISAPASALNTFMARHLLPPGLNPGCVGSIAEGVSLTRVSC
jgi:hypothetical protein